MCDPVTAIGAALSVGSTIANSSAQNQVAGARSRAVGAERARQQALQAQSDQVNERSRARYDGYGGQQDARAKQLGDYFNGANGAQPTGQGAGTTANTATSALPTSNSSLVVSEGEKQGAKAQASGQQEGTALGDLRAFGDTMGGINRGVARDAGEIGQINGFRQGSSAVLPYELKAANHRGDGLRGFADILGGAGRLGVVAGINRNVLQDANVPNAPLLNAPPTTGTIDGFGRALPALPPAGSLGNLYNIFPPGSFGRS